MIIGLAILALQELLSETEMRHWENILKTLERLFPTSR
jgi:hypothetical protein